MMAVTGIESVKALVEKRDYQAGSSCDSAIDSKKVKMDQDCTHSA